MLPITRCQAVKEPTADTSIYIAAYITYIQYAEEKIKKKNS